MTDLTKDAYKMLCIIYKQYLNKVKSGKSKTISKEFEDNFYLEDKALSSWHSEDIECILQELHSKCYLKRNIIGDFTLTDKTIIEMENRFKNGLRELIDFITKFK